ncbi:MAG TPA: glycosyltransferase family 4 protein [Allosphingosinicella sp.]
MTQPCSTRDLNPPIITFVGRLHASQKGLDTFLEAIALLARTHSSDFSAWIVGGRLDEAENLRSTIGRMPALREMHCAGRLILWGRVAPEALAEIYSRSRVVAMPSRRETFGLVAVQAMLCGTTVVAATVGGLRDTIVPRRTGLHVAPGDPSALAFVLGGLLRHPRLARWLGAEAREWAQPLFSDDGEHSGLRRILICQEGAPVGVHPIEEPAAYLARQDRREIESLTNLEAEPHWIASDHNSVFRVRLSEGERIAKRFTDRPDFDGTLYRLPEGMRTAGGAARFSRSMAAGESRVALEGTPVSERVLLFEKCESAGAAESEVADLADDLALGPPHPIEREAQSCRAALEDLAANPAWATLDAFDRAAGRLNASLSGDESVFVRCHPLAELLRLRLHLDAEAWPLPQGQLERVRAIVASSLEPGLVSAPGPRLAHGDLSARHVLMRRGALILCDLEQARFAFGDLDRAGLAADHVRLIAESRPGEARAALTRVATSGHAKAWFACELLHRALGSASWGRYAAIEQALVLCEVWLATIKARQNVSHKVASEDAPAGNGRSEGRPRRRPR